MIADISFAVTNQAWVFRIILLRFAPSVPLFRNCYRSLRPRAFRRFCICGRLTFRLCPRVLAGSVLVTLLTRRVRLNSILAVSTSLLHSCLPPPPYFHQFPSFTPSSLSYVALVHSSLFRSLCLFPSLRPRLPRTPFLPICTALLLMQPSSSPSSPSLFPTGRKQRILQHMVGPRLFDLRY